MRLLNLKINIYLFALLELVILPNTQCESYSNETIKQTTGKTLNRQKRLIQPLKIKIKDGNKIIELNLLGTNQRLAGKSVPVWHAIPSNAPKKDNVEYIERFQDFNTLGGFTAYHDIPHSAAFVHFNDRDELYGIVDTRYYIKKLPRRIAETTVHEAGGAYVKKQPMDKARHVRNVDIYNPTEPLNLKRTWLELKRNIEATNGTKSQRVRRDADYNPQKDSVFLEILVLANHNALLDIVGLTQLSDDKPYLDFLKYIVAYYNAVDLLFARFTQPTIQLNIAGLVIEKAADVFPFVSKFKIGRPEFGKRQRIDVEKVLSAITNHFTKFQKNTFTCDSFDAIMFLTKFKLFEPPDVYLDGVTRFPMDSYNQRLSKKCPSYMSVIAVDFQNDFQDFICAGHEIGHVLTITEHDKPRPLPRAGQTCQLHIMKAYGTNCPDCLTWSKQSVKALIKYFSSKSYCHLLNYPRSLSPNKPKRLLTRTHLCRCYQSKYSVPNVPLEDICSVQFACASRLSKERTWHPEPFDGTPCGPKKVCWNRQCQSAAPFILSLDNFIDEQRRFLYTFAEDEDVELY